MATHRFQPDRWHNVLGTVPPALSIADGDTVITQTIDANGWDKDGVKRADGPNPMNGPIFVQGAEPRAAGPGQRWPPTWSTQNAFVILARAIAPTGSSTRKPAPCG
jgi:hypothetical protein